jgi:type I restriction enzyme S subunit
MARKMKDSGIEWIGEIPEGWEVLAHKYIMHKEKSICEHYSGEDVISLTLNGVVKRDLENPSGKMPTTFDGYQFVDPNDLLLCLFDIDVTPRCVGLVKDYGVTSPAYSRFKIHSGFCNAYYNYLLRFIDDEKVFVHLSKNLRSSLTESDFGAIKTIVPPKAEQQSIADYLDNRTFEIDTLLSKARSSIEEYKKLKQAVITQAVTKGVRGEREMKDSGVEWIGEIPKEWDILNLVAHTSMLTPMRDRPENLDGPIPWIRIEDFDGKYISSSKASLGVSKETVRSMNLKIYPVGTILCTSSCIMGKCAIVSRELVSNQRFIGIIPDQNTCENFLYYLMLSNSERMNYLATGALQANLSRSSFEHLKVQFPSYQEQKEISDYLDTKCAEIDKLIAKKEQLVKELESYKKSLIYEVVTGKQEV